MAWDGHEVMMVMVTQTRLLASLFHAHTTLFSMARGKALSDDAWKILIHMHYNRLLEWKEVSKMSGVKYRTVARIIAQYDRTGDTQQETLCNRGRLRIINQADTQVSWA